MTLRRWKRVFDVVLHCADAECHGQQSLSTMENCFQPVTLEESTAGSRFTLWDRVKKVIYKSTRWTKTNSSSSVLQETVTAPPLGACAGIRVHVLYLRQDMLTF
ncbi:hypothetical protein AGIG_G22300 [Arapaima gigas]